jgi:hypothetical protein
MGGLEYGLMGKRGGLDFGGKESLGWYFRMWRWQDWIEGRVGRGNIVERYVDGLYEVGRVRLEG